MTVQEVEAMAQNEHSTPQTLSSGLQRWERFMRTPTLSNQVQEFWKTRKAAEALSHTCWDIFTQTAMREYARQKNLAAPPKFYPDCVYPGGLLNRDDLANLCNEFEACTIADIDVDGTSPFHSFDPFDHQSQMRNRSSITRVATESLCDAVSRCLEPHSQSIAELLGHHWAVPQICCHSYRNFENPDYACLSAAGWHLDGCPSGMKKIYIYLNGASKEIGSTEFSLLDGTRLLMEGGPGFWALFAPAVVSHRAIVPKKDPRPVVELLVVPALQTNPRPIPHALNTGFPWFPFENIVEENSSVLPLEYSDEKVRERTMYRWFTLARSLGEQPMTEESVSPYKVL